eukprot:TRINITY_DN6812_c0_g1_i1.p1 TRINITY_DN6812_c0_g1~~TRINITY_DN6812_c0_g1_i1.p1  ORF type:complete len:509 (-),score=86.23 TRINITY_DN6812_c0_g1_i1:26-1504(-)
MLYCGLLLSYVLHAAGGWIDPDTPQSAMMQRTQTGQYWKLVFSDEFDQAGRTFGPGDDPVWEAVDLHYWQTGDMEKYIPSGATTSGGNLVLTCRKQNVDGFQYTSGMVQSWNKFCFQGGRIEFNVKLPVGSGWWPAVWTMGNLGRAGYGGSTAGTWPYSYNSCDPAILPGDIIQPGFSGLVGQRINACDQYPSYGLHPGQGRAAPELDAAEFVTTPGNPQVSQSFQTAPFSRDRKTLNTSYPGPNTYPNHYTGGQYQQTASAMTKLASYGDNFIVVGFEYEPTTESSNGWIRWFVDDTTTFELSGTGVGPQQYFVGQRQIPVEPMYIIMNLALSSSFGPVSPNLPFPSEFLIDYVRVYQPYEAIGCDPPSHPTAQYIQAHQQAYEDASLKSWPYQKPSFEGSGFPQKQAYFCGANPEVNPNAWLSPTKQACAELQNEYNWNCYQEVPMRCQQEPFNIAGAVFSKYYSVKKVASACDWGGAAAFSWYNPCAIE